jgi:nucleoside-diphosphate-sugar epimerase
LLSGQNEDLLTGATGFIGGAVLKQCIASPSISTVFVLTRRDLPKDLSSSPKVKVILHDDFLSWPDSVLEPLKGAEGCIWCVGGRATSFPDVATARKVSVDFTLAAARKFSTVLASQIGDSRKFHFVFCSGWGAEMDPHKRLWMLADTRRIKVRRRGWTSSLPTNLNGI